MDYRYETKEEAKDFHKQRKAFIMLNKNYYFYQKKAVCHIMNIVKQKDFLKKNLIKLHIDKFNIYFGHLPEEGFALNYHY